LAEQRRKELVERKSKVEKAKVCMGIVLALPWRLTDKLALQSAAASSWSGKIVYVADKIKHIRCKKIKKY
jgi:hypothetical protein